MSKVKWNYVFGAITITAIVGGTIYVIVKAKQAEKLEEESITVEEAQAIMADQKEKRQFEKGEETVIFEADIDEVPLNSEDDIINKVIVNGPVTRIADLPFEEEDDEIDEDEIQAELDELQPDPEDMLHDGYPEVYDNISTPTIEPLVDFSYLEEGINRKEDKTLRYHKDSPEAKHQFIRMELSDFEIGSPHHRILLELFDFAFVPTNGGDELLRTQIIDYRVQFFGLGSKWNREVSYADLILHYARSAEFNCGETVRYWVEYFFEFSDFEPMMTSKDIDTLLLRLNNHNYFNESSQTFGLFGLTRESMDQAIRIANRSIYRQVTYETEFQEFLKSCL